MRLVLSTANPAIEIDEPIFKSGFILQPRYSVHSREPYAVARKGRRGVKQLSGGGSKDVSRFRFLSLVALRAPVPGHVRPALSRGQCSRIVIKPLYEAQ